MQKVMISDSKSLLEGRTRIEDEIRKKISDYLASKHILKWGVIARIVVKSGSGRWLYPVFDREIPDLPESPSTSQDKDLNPSKDMIRIARHNWKIMQQGIRFGLSVRIPKETLLANGILFFYIFVFLSLLYGVYRKTAKEARRIEIRNQEAMEAVNKSLETARNRLKEIALREKDYRQEISRLRDDLHLATDRVRETEEEALSEMEQLEKKLRENASVKEDLEFEVLHLKEELERLESVRKIPAKKQQKQVQVTLKRFRTLYKNIVIQERAVEGFLNLGTDLQLRAEELIHNMDVDSTKLTVKRKIFSRKGSIPTFECEFGYRGRIYWRPGPGSKTEILVIGTKNSQTKDLAHIEKL
ncbi:MAG: hypothetical protein DRH37_01830 [Deltaproteobacteria bacterium]|nr:MAG: hypothetical protein DRH37_01830 [Deltaproteobacteria bacterium]